MDLERFRGKVKAVRVGVQPHVRINDPNDAVVRPQIHVGHAKTFVLAYQIATDLGVPLWVRFKWTPGTIAQQSTEDISFSQSRVRRYVEVMLTAKDELSEMLMFFGIAVSRFYLTPRDVEVDPEWASRMRAVAFREVGPIDAAGWTSDSFCEWYDTAILNPGVLTVRGSDWCAPRWSVGTQHYVQLEEAIFKEAGNERFVVYLPLIMVGREKMAASRLNGVPWWVLTPMGAEGAVKFLSGHETKQWDRYAWLDFCRATR
jgi:hypothetical protein